MPFEVLDQRGVSSPSSLFSPERQASYSKSKAMLDYHASNGMAQTPTAKMVSASPLGKVLTMGAHSLDYSDPPQSFLDTDAQKGKPPHARKEESANLGRTLWTPLKQNPVTSPGFDLRSTSLSASSHINNTIESSLFSSSLSEMFSDKMRLSANKFPNHFGISVASSRREKERLESLQEIEAKCIGNLLPDGDDLFYGVGEELEPAINVSGNADMGDFDLFSSGGGMELEGDDALCASYADSHFIGGISGGHVEQHLFAEHPSRTLFVRNINRNVEESELRVLFEKYGDIQVLYMAFKHRGFVLISYYDIRASQNAMNSLHNRPLRQMKLDIHYSLPKDNPLRKEINHGILMVLNLDSSLSSDDLFQMFGAYGEIKKIHETTHTQHHKFVEFYDIRPAEAALRALNGTHVAGKQIMLKLSSPEGLIHCSRASEQDKPSLCLSPHAVATRPWGNTTMVSHGIDTSMCMENIEIQGSYSQNHGLPFMDMGFSQEFFSVSSTLPAATVASSGSKYGEARLAINNIKGGHPIQHLQPQSLPEYQYSLGSNTPYNIGNTISNITGNHMSGEMDTRRIQDVSAYEHSIELISHGNRSSPLHVNGRHFGSLSYQHLSSSPISWQKSPPFLNGTHSNGPLPLNGFPGSPFHTLPNMQCHHVGSAPSVNPIIWDRQHASFESPNVCGLPLGSLGSAGFLPVSTVNLPEVSPQSTLSQARRNCSEFSKKPTLHSPQQTSHMLHGRNSKIPVPMSFHPSGERMRFRRNEAIFNQADKKEYSLDIECILREGDSRTTLMIKNIPNKYTSKMLLAAIDENHRGTYDFVYLPIDFKNKCNVGYAFINMIDPLHIVPFYKTFEGKKWEKFNSEKVASLAYGRIQGKVALIAHFQNSSLMNEDKHCRPILFHTEGPNAGDQEPFPVGTNVRSRPGKPRTFNIDESHRQKSPCICNNADESNKRTDESSTSSDQE